MDTTAFKEQYPGLADIAEPRIEFYLDLATSFMNERRWPVKWIDWGQGLFTAHFLTLHKNGDAGRAGNVGPRSSASVHDVSKSYDTTVATEPSAGHWNLTTYGLEWRMIVRMVGAGPVQVPGSGNRPGTPLVTPFW